jgi:hypothetical protein
MNEDLQDNGSEQSINIRPGVSILSILRHLNYKPWFAAAEFVDNSLQSYIDNIPQLTAVHGPGFKLRVSINLEINDGGRITIRDNAAGIHEVDYHRAFRAADVPLDRKGLSEFGMGMKSAACWFGRSWMVRTSALGEDVERAVYFDIEKIVKDETELLTVRKRPSPPNVHFTEIIITDLNQPPQGKTVGKIKSHLASIYRVFIRNGQLELVFNEDVLAFSEPCILVAPYYKDETAPAKEWRKDIILDWGLETKIHGFAALRETGSTSDAGFALFRRNRLIEGSMEDSYRPETIFGKSNSFASQRLFGELHLEGFEVSHTKDGFRWEEHEDIFLEQLKNDLNTPEMPLLHQSEGYRVRPKPQDLRPAAETATRRTADVIEREAPQIIQQQIETPPEVHQPPFSLPERNTAARREITVNLHEERWVISLELSSDPAVSDWLSICDQPSNAVAGSIRHIGIRLSLSHPFMNRFAGVDSERIEPLLRIAAALALAEVAARESGASMAGTIRRNVNELLGDALSKP